MEQADFETAFADARAAALRLGWQAGMAGGGGGVPALIVQDPDPDGSKFWYPTPDPWDAVEMLRRLTATKEPRLVGAMKAAGVAIAKPKAET